MIDNKKIELEINSLKNQREKKQALKTKYEGEIKELDAQIKSAQAVLETVNGYCDKFYKADEVKLDA